MKTNQQASPRGLATLGAVAPPGQLREDYWKPVRPAGVGGAGRQGCSWCGWRLWSSWKDRRGPFPAPWEEGAEEDPPTSPSCQYLPLGKPSESWGAHRPRPQRPLPGHRAGQERVKGGSEGQAGAYPTQPTDSPSRPLSASILVQHHGNSVTFSLGNENVNQFCSHEKWGKRGERNSV